MTRELPVLEMKKIKATIVDTTTVVDAVVDSVVPPELNPNLVSFVAFKVVISCRAVAQDLTGFFQATLLFQPVLEMNQTSGCYTLKISHLFPY